MKKKVFINLSMNRVLAVVLFVLSIGGILLSGVSMITTYAMEMEQENSSEELPKNAQQASPTSATGVVTEHVVMAQDASEETVIGKEFYTIQTENGKVFYLIIETARECETVYFLTEISENDLLNVITDNSQTLPKNSAAVESGIPVKEGLLSNNSTQEEATSGNDVMLGSTSEGNKNGVETLQASMEYSNKGAYIMMGIVAVVAAIGGYYVMVIKKKRDSLDEDYDEEEAEELVNEDEEQEVE